MNKIRLFSGLALFTISLVACAPGNGPASSIRTTVEPGPTVLPTINPSTLPVATAAEPTPTPLPIATSRGPELHATDPTTVNLASGGLHLVEFFRFT